MEKFYSVRRNAITTRDLWRLLQLTKEIQFYPKRTSWIADVISAYR